MQATRLVQDFRSGTQVQVVGVTQDDLRPDVVLEVAERDSLDGAYRTHGHENRGLDIAVVGMYDSYTRSCPGIRIFQVKKIHFVKFLDLKFKI